MINKLAIIRTHTKNFFLRSCTSKQSYPPRRYGYRDMTEAYRFDGTKGPASINFSLTYCIDFSVAELEPVVPKLFGDPEPKINLKKTFSAVSLEDARTKKSYPGSFYLN